MSMQNSICFGSVVRPLGGGLGLISHWASCLKMFLFDLEVLNTPLPVHTIGYVP